MIKYTKEEVIKLLRSGNFTIIYWDNELPSLYEGKGYDVNDFPNDKEKINIPYNEHGYLPTIVALMAEALNGEADSI